MKILTDEDRKDFVVISFSEYFESIRKEQYLRKVALSLHIFLITPYEVEKCVQSSSSDNFMHHYNIEILNLFHPEIQLINTNPDIEHKLNELLSDSKKFKVWTVLVLGYNK